MTAITDIASRFFGLFVTTIIVFVCNINDRNGITTTTTTTKILVVNASISKNQIIQVFLTLVEHLWVVKK